VYVSVRGSDEDGSTVPDGGNGFSTDGTINVPLGTQGTPDLGIVEFINERLQWIRRIGRRARVALCHNLSRVKSDQNHHQKG